MCPPQERKKPKQTGRFSGMSCPQHILLLRIDGRYRHMEMDVLAAWQFFFPTSQSMDLCSMMWAVDTIPVFSLQGGWASQVADQYAVNTGQLAHRNNHHQYHLWLWTIVRHNHEMSWSYELQLFFVNHHKKWCQPSLARGVCHNCITSWSVITPRHNCTSFNQSYAIFERCGDESCANARGHRHSPLASRALTGSCCLWAETATLLIGK